MNTVYFWPDPVQAFRELRRVLAEGGLLVLGFRTPASMAKLPFTRYQNHYEGEEVQRMMESAGFREVGLTPGSDRLGAFLSASGRK